MAATVERLLLSPIAYTAGLVAVWYTVGWLLLGAALEYDGAGFALVVLYASSRLCGEGVKRVSKRLPPLLGMLVAGREGRALDRSPRPLVKRHLTRVSPSGSCPAQPSWRAAQGHEHAVGIQLRVVVAHAPLHLARHNYASCWTRTQPGEAAAAWCGDSAPRVPTVPDRGVCRRRTRGAAAGPPTRLGRRARVRGRRRLSRRGGPWHARLAGTRLRRGQGHPDHGGRRRVL